jgi:hypothetical protein
MAMRPRNGKPVTQTMPVFRASSTMLPIAGRPFDHFWQVQDAFLVEGQAFAQRWFARRHEATRSAMQAVRDTLADGAGRPTETAAVLSDWQRHSWERVAEDVRDWADFRAACASAAFRHETETGEEVARAVASLAGETSEGRHATPV